MTEEESSSCQILPSSKSCKIFLPGIQSKLCSTGSCVSELTLQLTVTDAYLLSQSCAMKIALLTVLRYEDCLVNSLAL